MIGGSPDVRGLLKTSAALLRLLLAGALAVLALRWRWPLAVEWRPLLLAGVPAVAALLLALELSRLFASGRRRGRAVGAAGLATALLAAGALGLAAGKELRFRLLRREVLAAEPERLARLGQHVVVGYRDLAEARLLTGRGAVGGVFVTRWNVAGRTAEALAAEVAGLQAARPPGAPPLWIAADQEGGLVSRLSPPLERQPSLSTVAGACAEDGPGCAAAVEGYAALQAGGLARLGVNLDLAPVVDLDAGAPVPGDRYSRIHERAISADPGVVARVADAYCAALGDAGVACALKHFPGLGRLQADTHRDAATLTASAEALAAADWRPFEVARGHPARFTMVGHARLAAIDPARPASFSAPVVRDLLRGRRGVDGPIVTDDLCMMAAFRSREGIGEAAVLALSAGVDLVLVSYDPDQYWEVMAALLRAERTGRLSPAALAESVARLDRARDALARPR